MISNQVTFTISTLVDLDETMTTEEDKEAFLKEWIAETYPEFYNTYVENIKEIDKE